MVRIADKKAQEWSMFVQIILFVALFLIGWGLYNMLTDWWVGDNIPQGTLKSMERIDVEANSAIRDDFDFPLFIDERHKIVVFSQGGSRLYCEEGKSCICACAEDSHCENNALKKCVISDAVFRGDKEIVAHFNEHGDPTTFTCYVSKKEEGFEIGQC